MLHANLGFFFPFLILLVNLAISLEDEIENSADVDHVMHFENFFFSCYILHFCQLQICLGIYHMNKILDMH